MLLQQYLRRCWYWYSSLNLEVLFGLFAFLYCKFCIFISEILMFMQGSFFKLLFFFLISEAIEGKAVFCLKPRKCLISQIKHS